MGQQCKAINRKGMRCKSTAEFGERYCKAHLPQHPRRTTHKLSFLKKPEFFIPTILAVLLGIAGIYYTKQGPTREEMKEIVGNTVQEKLEAAGLVAPESVENIVRAIGKSYPEVVNTVIDKIENANGALLSGRYPEAERLYKVLVTMFPDVPHIRFNLASSYYYQGKLKEAKDELRVAIKIRPDYAEAYSNLGITLLKTAGNQNLEDGINYLRQAIKLNPSDPEYHSNLATILKAKGNIKEAIFHYQEAIKLNPSEPGFYYNLGNLYSQINRLDSAIVLYQQAIKLNRNYENAHFNLGNAYHAQKKYDKAAEEYKEVIRINPNAGDAHNSLGSSLYRQRKVKDAIREFRKAIEINPKDSLAQHNLSIAIRASGE